MVEGFLFYWISWILWIIITFFMPKGRMRTSFACFILLFIMCSDTSIKWNGITITLSFIVLLFGLLLFHRIARSFYLMFASFSTCLAYTAILFWAKITPVWLFMPRSILIPLVINTIVIMLVKDFYDRLAVGLLGMAIGELYFSYILASYSINDPMGGMTFMEIIVIFIMLHTVLHSLKVGKYALYAKLQEYQQSLKQPEESINIENQLYENTLQRKSK